MKKKILSLLVLIIMFFSIFNNAYASKYHIERLYQYYEDYAVAGVWEGVWKYGYIDKSGNWIIEPKYYYADNFYEGVAGVGIRKDKDSPIKYGYINKEGEYLISPEYDCVSNFDEGYAVVGIGEYGNRKCGLIDENQTFILDLKYKYISGFNHINKFEKQNIIKVTNEDNKVGLYFMQQKKLIEPSYDKCLMLDTYIRTSKKINGKDKKGMIFFDGKVIEPVFDSVSGIFERIYNDFGIESDLKQTYLKVGKDGKYGIIDYSGYYISDVIYDDIRIYTCNNSFIVKSNGKEQVLQKDGTYLNNEKYDDIIVNRNNYYVMKNGKKGIIKKDGSILIIPKYDDIAYFGPDGYAKVFLNNKQGIIDKRGNEILEPVYDYIDRNYYQNQIVVETIGNDGIKTCMYEDDTSTPPVVKVKKNGKESFLNNDFTPIQNDNNVVCDYDSIGIYEDELARVTKKDKVGYVRLDQSCFIKPVYDNAYRAYSGSTKQNYFEILKDGKYGIVFMDGTIIDPIFDNSPIVSEDIVLGKVNDIYKFIDKNNKIINDEVYKVANAFSEGKALVGKKVDQLHFIDKNGNKVSDIYKEATSYGEGLAYVSNGENGRYIDHNEKTVIGDNISLWQGFPFQNSIAPAGGYSSDFLNKFYGILKKDGTWLVEPVFDRISNLSNGKYKYYLKDKEAEVTSNGEIIWK
ncbi:hypothetical protein AN1V17_13410 [Vallitalea sediminicola]